MTSALFSPLRLRGTTLRNRVVISPMCTYSADDGMASDFHLAHYARFAMGGAGLVIVEATGVTPKGRISNGCLGLWSDAHAQALGRIAQSLKSFGAVAGIQIGHAGRKASSRRGYLGDGPLLAEDLARGEVTWAPVGASALPFAEGWPVPKELSADEIEELILDFVAAAKRAAGAGFEVVELHFAHGYLVQSFLSPLSNQRQDAWGGGLEGRMKLALDIAERVRAALPEDVALFARISAVEWLEVGWQIEDSLALAAGLKACGVDVVDCSTGGNMAAGGPVPVVPQHQGYQAEFAARIRHEVGLAVQAVGLIREPAFAEDLVASGKADLVAIGREALYDPQWPLHAEVALAQHTGSAAPAMAGVPVQFRNWLTRWARGIEKRGERV